MIAALIVAAGQGERMGAARRKQYLALGGRSILSHTLKIFDACGSVDHIVLVVPEDDMDYCRREVIAAAAPHTATFLVAGGQRRQDSVCKGLQALGEEEAIVLIHDGVRPLVATELIEACIQGAQRWGACIPAIEVTDTIKKIDGQGIIEGTVSRKYLRMAQTPQAFKLSLIKEAHRLAGEEDWPVTDDASLVEQMGVAVHVIPGSPTNIKITTPEDLRIAEAFLGLCLRRDEIE